MLNFVRSKKIPFLTAALVLMSMLAMYEYQMIQNMKHRGDQPCGMLGSDGAVLVSPEDRSFNWTIFITPQGFTGLAGRFQRRAIQSWLLLEPKPHIVMLGFGDGFDAVQAEFDVEIDPHLDLNFVQMPLAGSVIDRAMRANTEISVIVNSDILLTQSFVDAMAKTRHNFDDWFLIGARYDLTELPPVYEPSREDFNQHAFVNYARTKGVLHTAGGIDYFAWNNNGKRLLHGIMPPFIRGKSKFDNWFVHEVLQAGYRDVIDGTEAVTAVHVNHDYHDTMGRVSKSSEIQRGATFWMGAKKSNWQIFHNNNLAVSYGSYRNQDGTTVHAPWKLSACLEPGGMCLIKRLRPGLCPCEHNSFALNTQNDPQIVEVYENDVRKHLIRCGAVSADREDAYKISVGTSQGHPPVYGLPWTMRDLLPVVARNNHVIVTGVSFGYRDVLMNFVCNLRRLGIYDSLIVAAFDEEAYRFAFKMGIPAFYYETDAVFNSDMGYGSQGFKQVTKLKSQVVLQILKLGYDVTWTDTDIVWFKNPLPTLQSMESDFVVQSNAPWPAEKAANGPLRINSGFYRVRATAIAIEAMERIVEHAATSKLTEQPSFYIILCGGRDGTTTVGDSKCEYRMVNADALDGQGTTVMTVQYLDRQKYPNGAVGDFWEAEDVIQKYPDIVLLHNNWIRGLRAKVRRILDKKLWFYNREHEICDYSPVPEYKFNWVIEEGDSG